MTHASTQVATSTPSHGSAVAPSALRLGRREKITVAAYWITGAIPLGLALLMAARAPRMHVLLDYWHVLAKITTDDGNLIPAQLFTYHLDQPFVIPSLLFWADAAWFGGDNRVLTVLTVILMTGVAAALRSMLLHTMPTTRRAVLTAGIVWLMLSSHAAELWLQGTNGISWAPAVFFCVLAIALAHRGRMWIAGAAAVLGCLSFGAALPIWFALALVAWLRRDSKSKIVTPAVVGVVILGFWFATKPSGQQSLASSAFDPDGRLAVLAAAVGGLWSTAVPIVAVIAGAVTLALLGLATTRTFTARSASVNDIHADAGWIGVAFYAVSLGALLALGRTSDQVPGGNVGLISRYVLVAALATSALLVLTALHRPGLSSRHLIALVATVALTTHAIGGTKADAVRRDYTPLTLAAIALRIDAPATLAELHIQRAARPAAQALGAYPFNSAFTLGCHGLELGNHIDLNTATPAAQRGALDKPAMPDTIITGWSVIEGNAADCVLVTDANGTITGGGITHLPHPGTPDAAGGSGWQAVAPPNTGPTVLIQTGKTLYRIQALQP